MRCTDYQQSVKSFNALYWLSTIRQILQCVVLKIIRSFRVSVVLLIGTQDVATDTIPKKG